MRGIWIAAFVALLLAPAGLAQAQTAPMGAGRTIALSRIETNPEEPLRYGVSPAPACGYSTAQVSLLAPWEASTSRVVADFNTRAERAGFRVSSEAGSLFASQTPSTDFQVGAILKRLTGELCGNMLTGYQTGRAHLELTVEWQIYSAIQRRVVGRLTTSVQIDQNTSRTQMTQVVVALFDKALDALYASTEFRDAFSAAPASAANVAAPAAGAGVRAAPATATTMTGPPAGAVVPVPEAVGAVVTVINGAGHGSGALVGSEGYVITNAHVVSEAGQVTIRWSDGLETVGDVVRKDEPRDVALIKTRDRGRQPLALKTGSTAVGTEVYAIGAPLQTDLSGTVTRGIVSANRVLDGFSWVQSDVTVNPGNSGGPLVDAQGRIVALTDIGIRPEGVPTGINLFIPAQDIIDFLNLEVRAPAAP